LSFISLLIRLLSLCDVNDVLIKIIIPQGLVGHIRRVFMIICVGLFMLVVQGCWVMVAALTCFFGAGYGLKNCYC